MECWYGLILRCVCELVFADITTEYKLQYCLQTSRLLNSSHSLQRSVLYISNLTGKYESIKAAVPLSGE